MNDYKLSCWSFDAFALFNFLSKSNWLLINLSCFLFSVFRCTRWPPCTAKRTACPPHRGPLQRASRSSASRLRNGRSPSTGQHTGNSVVLHRLASFTSEWWEKPDTSYERFMIKNLVFSIWCFSVSSHSLVAWACAPLHARNSILI